MHITKLNLVYFSPTGSTKRVLRLIADQLQLETAEYDLTPYAARDTTMQFGADEFVLFGFPVYGGRVPETFTERLGGITGSGTPCTLVGTYGNREYHDALLELRNITKAGGFVPIGAAAIVTEHSVIREVAAGRPDERDIAFLKEFGDALKRKLESVVIEEARTELMVPGNEPYMKHIHLPMAPDVSPNCTACGLCAKQCPVGAISTENPRITDQHACIGCMRCVRLCPKGARNLARGKYYLGQRFLAKARKVRKEPELFF